MTTQISVDQLKRAVVLKEEIESLLVELGGILGNRGGVAANGGRRKLSAAGRQAIRLAQMARRAKARGEKTGRKGRRRMSAAGRAKIAAAAKERWKKAKAAGKNRL